MIHNTIWATIHSTRSFFWYATVSTSIRIRNTKAIIVNSNAIAIIQSVDAINTLIISYNRWHHSDWEPMRQEDRDHILATIPVCSWDALLCNKDCKVETSVVTTDFTSSLHGMTTSFFVHCCCHHDSVTIIVHDSVYSGCWIHICSDQVYCNHVAHTMGQL